MVDQIYTAISFAPVQGFIEKSRKLRDLFGASQILSYLSAKIVSQAQKNGVKVISPSPCADNSNMDIIQGMPNRILIEGEFSYNDAASAIAEGWNEIISACRRWIEENPQLSKDFTFSGEGWGRAWTKWKINAWEIFWGKGIKIEQAMLALETNKLRRDWTVPNWNGESSTLSGADAIAYPNMDNNVGRQYNSGREREEIRNFYEKLAEALKNTKQQNDPIFLDPTEWLSIPELIKRLVTHHQVAKLIDKKRSLYTKSFREIIRAQEDGGYWTGWFMGDGDGVGKHLKENLKTSKDIQDFSHTLRTWGREFQTYFNANLGRVVYAGGDDFLGVMFGTENKLQQDGTEKLEQKNGTEALKFLIGLHSKEGLENGNTNGSYRWDSGKLGINLSVGFVWAGHSVPQRDVLQHCREAEKVAKNLGKNRVTIRILFNNGQYVEWTTPWEYLHWLKDYSDRNQKKGQDANWSHVYSDLAQLKARHAIPPKSARQNSSHKDVVALSLLGLYFGEEKKTILSEQRKTITGSESTESVVRWIEGMIQVGWQLCSNS